MRRRKRSNTGRTLGPPDRTGRNVGFWRNFQSFHGGHLKVFDYFNHVLASDGFVPSISFSPKSVWDDTNPWASAGLVEIDDPPPPDVHFLAGRDWVNIEKASDVPVINLIQHVRHAEPGHPLGEFLPRRAIRICVSEEVADAVRAAGANGPVHAIPNGIDLASVTSHASEERTVDLLIVANKKPEVGRKLQQAFDDRSTRLIDEMIPRDAFLDEIGTSARHGIPAERHRGLLPSGSRGNGARQRRRLS